MAGVGTRISSDTTRPLPPALGSSAWQTMPSSTSDSCVRICALLVRREDVDDAVDRLRRRVGVQRAERQVAGLGDPQRRLDRLEVAHLADEHDVGVLAQRRAQRVREAVRVAVHLALVDQAALVLVDVLDRVLDREDVLVALALILSIIAASVVDLPLPVGPVTSTSPRGRSASVASTGGSPSSSKPSDLLGNQPVDGRHRAALVEHVAAEARRGRGCRTRSRAPASPRSASSARRSARCRRAAWSRPAVRSGSSSRCSLPCTRTCGGVLGRDVQVGPSSSTVVFSRSGSVGACDPTCCQARASPFTSPSPRRLLRSSSRRP